MSWFNTANQPSTVVRLDELLSWTIFAFDDVPPCVLKDLSVDPVLGFGHLSQRERHLLKKEKI
jgi:hypothetical protein